MTAPTDDDLEHREPGPDVYARHVLIGLLADSADLGRRGLSAAGRAATGAGRFWGAVLDPVLASPLLAPLRRASAAVGRRGSEQVERWARLGRLEEARGKELARELIHVPVDEVVAVLRDDPQLKELVRDQARALLDELAEDAELERVVRIQSDGYLEHLREHPEGVRELVQLQSSGMTTDLANVVRGWAASLDAWLDRLVGKVLRRPSREPLDGTPRRGQVAGFASRLLAFVVDLAIIAGTTLIASWIWASLLKTLGIDALHCAAIESGSKLAEAICHSALWLGIAVATLFPTAYILFFWTATGQTPGKAVAGVRIVRTDQAPMGFGHSVVRMVGYFLSLWSFGLGFAAILFSRERRAWHDMIARTLVVYSWQPDD